MPGMNRRALLAGLGAAALPAAARAAYPDRPITWIVAYAPGGGTDTLARLIGQSMAARLGQPVVIDNRPGAATNIGAEAAARAPADGYTIFTADNGTLIFNQALFKRLPYDPDRDFRPLGLFARFHLVLAVRRDSPIRDIGDYVARVKAQPGSIDYASPGIGSPHHLAMERLMREAGARASHIPYRGAGPAVNDLIAGNVESMMLDLAAGIEFLRARRIRPLAVCSAERIDLLPEVPTMRESLGLPDFTAHAWQTLQVPRATPDPVVQRLAAALHETMQEPAVVNRMKDMALEPLDGDPAAAARLIAQEEALWLPLIRSMGITLD
jgi:tripartite-type tricarboxylate transporter receptor subunit TctC